MNKILDNTHMHNLIGSTLNFKYLKTSEQQTFGESDKKHMEHRELKGFGFSRYNCLFHILIIVHPPFWISR